MESRAEFKYPNAQYYEVETYNQANGTSIPVERDDFQTGPSISKGTNTALFARDKMQLTNRLLVEAVCAGSGKRARATSASRRWTPTSSRRGSRAALI